MNNRSKTTEKVIWGVVGIGFVFLVWYLGSLSPSMGRLLPNPWDVFRFVGESFVKPIGKQTVLGHVYWSLTRVIIGYLLAAVVGILLGLAMSWSKIGEAIIKPFYLMVRPIPAIAWIPLTILWFGIGENSKYFLIFIGTMSIIMTNTADGVRGVDSNLLGVARMLGCKERQLFMKVVLPSAVPQIFAGLQVGIGVSWATVLAAEMIGANEGVGWIIIVAQDSCNMTQIFAGIVIIGVVGFTLISLMRGAEANLCAWNVRGK